MTSTLLERNTIDMLTGRLDGELLLPNMSGYDAARAIWNGMIDHKPAFTIRPRSVIDVQRAVAFAQEQELPLSIKSGGHNVAGHAVADGGVMLDMSLMRGVSVNPEARTARVEGGATWADFDRETSPYGLGTTGGVISTTGVAGLTLGGGIGWLMGKHGLVIDNLREVELVTAGGDFVTANRDENPDLFWALRGGGGNFGVATSFEFDLRPVDLVLAGMVAYPIEQAREVLAFYRELTENAPDGLTAYCSLMTDPEHGIRVIVLPICWSGELRDGERVLEPLMKFGAPLVREIGPMPYAEWQTAFDPLFPYGSRYYWKGAMLPRLADGAFDVLVEQATETPLPRLAATIECYAGPMTRVAMDATAFPHRDAPYQILAIGAWEDPADDETGRAWARTLHDSLMPYSKQGSFLNFNSVEEGTTGRVQASFGVNWDRLVSVKRRYDPGNVFRCNNNIA
jgi:FAD/FMN-containing dehydrogenase